ncbi:hypothetical protein C8R46DRAFT_1119608 [Mycena filopes]|nr:hypothetical protein C8R46DRAFT_1119608 [Mycena filopes]
MIEAYVASFEQRTPLEQHWMDSYERYYADLLASCVQTVYFSRWMRGHSDAANALMNTLAGQLAQLPIAEWTGPYEAQRQIQRLKIFVYAALRARQCAPKHAVHIPLETREKVIPFLKNLRKLVTNELRTPKWRKDLAEDFLKPALINITNSLQQYFDGEQRFGGTRDLTMKADVKQRWDVCAAKSSQCTVSDKKKLRECAKCHTVRYCCPEHQRAHWKEHKPTCFVPSY